MDSKLSNTDREKAVLVGVIINDDDDSESMEELKELAKTAGADVVGIMTQVRTNIDRNSYIGKGKLIELKQFVDNMDIDLVIINDELSGSQLKNIEETINRKVIDRTSLILDIFAGRAKSSEGILQVELAQLKYRLPRLQGLGNDLSRLGGGIGTRGPGETKLETDRRYIRERIKTIERKLEDLKRHRELLRERRRKNEVPVVAIVGYTNAGKSTLMNALTDSSVYVEDKLFATLDPTARKLDLPSGREAILIDTVGFIRKLPHDLVEAFKSTLEESKYADVLLHVIDITSKDIKHKIEVVENVLRDLEAIDKPIIKVYNKSDLLEQMPVNKDNEIYISAKEMLGIDELLKAIDNVAYKDLFVLDFYFPYAKNKEYLFLKRNSKILKEEYDEKGIKIKAQVSAVEKNILRDFIIF
ncbi:GTP-binding protein [Thermoanaerobacterium thermosaccharolyticum]|uniref:GTPase HflX n=2 Tax=Thermoanaerobacterium thermosaccharolyticum TaxID=1517 RepID=D9TPB2_THETC|nr:GTPase HflX [Thermoanaerobacterium thermosaccharolyticum]ADL69089.1 GTP-binding proten HflX [Thermoanaerobacterium thermosaccharolyticum DSM 571]AST58864.1 GTP-binding protein [Thermoanaerobacterium thermosaccharolyticum]